MRKFIYKTTNLINGKIYIGQHSNDDDKYLGSGVLLKLAINKYGKDSFKREILKDNIKSQIKLDVWEIYFIKKYKSYISKIGYNLSYGNRYYFGFKRLEMNSLISDKIKKSQLLYWKDNFEARQKRSILSKNMRHSQETKNKISINSKLTKHTEQTKEIIRLANSGENNHNFGKSMTDEIKSKIRQTMKNKLSTLENRKLMSDRAKEAWKKRKQVQ